VAIPGGGELLPGERADLAELGDWILQSRPCRIDLNLAAALAAEAAAGPSLIRRLEAEAALCQPATWERVRASGRGSEMEADASRCQEARVALQWDRVLREQILELAARASREWRRPQLSAAIALAWMRWMLELRRLGRRRMSPREGREWRRGGAAAIRAVVLNG
jgi:hypothetical protein